MVSPTPATHRSCSGSRDLEPPAPTTGHQLSHQKERSPHRKPPTVPSAYAWPRRRFHSRPRVEANRQALGGISHTSQGPGRAWACVRGLSHSCCAVRNLVHEPILSPASEDRRRTPATKCTKTTAPPFWLTPAWAMTRFGRRWRRAWGRCNEGAMRRSDATSQSSCWRASLCSVSIDPPSSPRALRDLRGHNLGGLRG